MGLTVSSAACLAARHASSSVAAYAIAAPAAAVPMSLTVDIVGYSVAADASRDGKSKGASNGQ